MTQYHVCRGGYRPHGVGAYECSTAGDGGSESTRRRTLGGTLAVSSHQRHSSRVDLDAGNDAVRLEHLDHRLPVARLQAVNIQPPTLDTR